MPFNIFINPTFPESFPIAILPPLNPNFSASRTSNVSCFLSLLLMHSDACVKTLLPKIGLLTCVSMPVIFSKIFLALFIMFKLIFFERRSLCFRSRIAKTSSKVFPALSLDL